MGARDWRLPEPLTELHKEIQDLDLEENIIGLEASGYTVVRPEKVGNSQEHIDGLLNAIFDVVERRTGVRPDLENGTTPDADHRPQPMDHYAALLFEGRIFEEYLMNPIGLTLATYLLTTGAEPLRPMAPQIKGSEATILLRLSECLIKGPGERDLYLHCDNGAIPAPFPPYQQVCNVTTILTDYDRDNGALCFVPGSHRWCRHPTPSERLDFGRAVPVEAPRGSMVVWGGNQWHGAFARRAPGLRVSMLYSFGRQYLPGYSGEIPADALTRNPQRFAQLLGKSGGYGYAEHQVQLKSPATTACG
jgi:hypothetical protein